MLGKDTKEMTTQTMGMKTRKRNYQFQKKIHQGQEKGFMIKKTSSKLREPHKDIIQRTQVTTKNKYRYHTVRKKNKMDGRDRMKQDTMRTLP
jgi:hypothetical protein